jgi:hypothetical protein
MNKEMETKFEVIGFYVIEVISRHLPGGNEENHKYSVSISGALTQIQTESGALLLPQPVVCSCRHRAIGPEVGGSLFPRNVSALTQIFQ